MKTQIDRKMQQLNVRVSRTLVEELKSRAAADGEPASVIVRKAIRDLLRPQLTLAPRG